MDPLECSSHTVLHHAVLLEKSTLLIHADTNWFA